MQQGIWLKKEMLAKIKETKLSLLAMTEDQLHTTTQRTIMENEQMTTELQYQSRQTGFVCDGQFHDALSRGDPGTCIVS